MLQLEDLEAFCADLESKGVERVVVRWIDERRPVHDEGGVTVEKVTEATLKTAVDGEVVTETFEEIPYEQLRAALAPFEFEVLYRSDNLTRR